MDPKLVAEDIPPYTPIGYTPAKMSDLKERIRSVCSEEFLVCGEGEEQGGGAWMEKVLELNQICSLNHGIMMVGPSGSGKSTAWRVLLKALERLEGVEGVAHVIHPKAMSKEMLYGVLDQNTGEWTDGVFTHILRKIIDDDESTKQRHWIIFDDDLDPVWAENLNSVLDDSKILTLPTGERLSLPSNVRIMFEVQDLKFATAATVSRCGMIWFSEDILPTEMVLQNFLRRLCNVSLDEGDDEGSRTEVNDEELSPSVKVQREVASVLEPFFNSADGLIVKCLNRVQEQEHIMGFTRLGALNSLFSMLNHGVRKILQYNCSNKSPLPSGSIKMYSWNYLVYALLWSFAGDAKLKVRSDLEDFIRSDSDDILPSPFPNTPMMDCEVMIRGLWSPWCRKIPQIIMKKAAPDVPMFDISTDVMIPTLDTVKPSCVLLTWIDEHIPLVLFCGPPGSGKTVTLLSALEGLPDTEVWCLDFSSATTPEYLLENFDRYCEYSETTNGVVLAPTQVGKRLIFVLDECNSPDMDQFDTQRVMSFIRQLVEQRGFYRSSDKAWVSLKRIQFVGVCHPPNYPGCKNLSGRLLRHAPVIYIASPGKTSLQKICSTFNGAILDQQNAEILTNAMLEFYLASKEKFTQEMQPHYVHSPREMIRWLIGIGIACEPSEELTTCVRLWAHEAMRVFQDRLIHDSDRKWTSDLIDAVAKKYFSELKNYSVEILARPIMYSNWLPKDHKDYISVDKIKLKEHVTARLKSFCEKESDVPLVNFDEFLDHALRIDHIFRQHQGHVLLIGVPGVGKTTTCRFVAWMNGLSVFQIKAHNKYTSEDFDKDLRSVLIRSGCKDEKIAFILDESVILKSGFWEKINELMYYGLVSGLFEEEEEHNTLMEQCKEGAHREESDAELYSRFVDQVMLNLHVVWIMNWSSEDLKDRAAKYPALFNRCIVKWFGDLSTASLHQVGKEFTSTMNLDRPSWEAPAAYSELPSPPTHRDAVINACVYVHQTVHQENTRLAERGGRTMAITPGHYFDFIKHFVKLYNKKGSYLKEQQIRRNVGLSKIQETVEQVEEMRISLEGKSNKLKAKTEAASAKLTQMRKDEQEAQKNKVQGQELQAELEKRWKAAIEMFDSQISPIKNHL